VHCPRRTLTLEPLETFDPRTTRTLSTLEPLEPSHPRTPDTPATVCMRRNPHGINPGNLRPRPPPLRASVRHVPQHFENGEVAVVRTSAPRRSFPVPRGHVSPPFFASNPKAAASEPPATACVISNPIDRNAPAWNRGIKAHSQIRPASMPHASSFHWIEYPPPATTAAAGQ